MKREHRETRLEEKVSPRTKMNNVGQPEDDHPCSLLHVWEGGRKQVGEVVPDGEGQCPCG